VKEQFALLAIVLAEGEQAAQPGPGIFGFVFPLLLIAGIYFFFLRPMRNQEKQRKDLLGSIKKNDRVVTSGGLIGVIVNIRDKDDEVVLKIDDNSNVKARVTRSSIVRVLTDSAGSEETTENKS
jgi:preprotein translocase subunit YajC